MEKRLFGEKESEKKEREYIKASALSTCTEEHLRLIKCFKNSWLGWCSKEREIFWNCFEEERGKLYFEKSAVPEGHWKDTFQNK